MLNDHVFPAINKNTIKIFKTEKNRIHIFLNLNFTFAYIRLSLKRFRLCFLFLKSKKYINNIKGGGEYSMIGI